MTFADLSPLANHLWQSTLCVAVAWLLTLGMRKNRAAVRYGLWMAASVKFLIPFSLLVSAGAQLEWRAVPIIAPPRLSSALDDIAQPFAAQAPAPLPAVAAPVLNPLPAILFAVWLCGIAIGIVFWLRCWWRVRSMRRAATPLELNLPVKVMSSPTHREPGVFGIRKPCLLLPEGIADRLTPPQLEAILAHELRHVQRRDNLTAAIHMLVETIFWFHPCVWWIRARLMEERERACDEEVVRMGSEPQVYAESILKVCEFYLASPAPCAAGVTGGGLKKRIESIMANRIFHKLSFAQKALLALAAVGAVAGPVATGLAGTPGSQSQLSALPAFEVASVKPDDFVFAGRGRYSEVTCSNGRFVSRNASVWYVIKWAWNIVGDNDRIVGYPDWTKGPGGIYVIEAKAAAPVSENQCRLMVRTLLADRFHLRTHEEKRMIDALDLVVSKEGPKIRRVTDPDAPVNGPGFTVSGETFQMLDPQAKGWTMEQLAYSLQMANLGRKVFDRTGLEGIYRIDLKFRRADDDSGEGPDVTTALRDQLGLQLRSAKEPLDVVVVDHIERPSRN